MIRMCRQHSHRRQWWSDTITLPVAVPMGRARPHHNLLDKRLIVLVPLQSEVGDMAQARHRKVGDEAAAPLPKPSHIPQLDTAPDYELIAALKRTKIAEVARRLAELGQMKVEIEREEKDLKLAGAGLLIHAGVKTVMVDGTLRVTQLAGKGQDRIDRTLLLKYGVKEKTIEKSTIAGTPWVSLKVTVKKEKTDGGGEGGDQ